MERLFPQYTGRRERGEPKHRLGEGRYKIISILRLSGWGMMILYLERRGIYFH